MYTDVLIYISPETDIAPFFKFTLVCYACVNCCHLLSFLRDTTVQSLTLQPTVEGGVVTYQDSPLVSVNSTMIGECMKLPMYDEAVM